MRLSQYARGAFVSLVGAAMVSCSVGQEGSSELVVSAAISLKAPLEEMARIHQERHPGTRVQLNLGASGLLAAQIVNGAPVDIFASASTEFLDDLEQKDLLLRGTRRLLAGNVLVLVVPKGSNLARKDWGSLTSFGSLAIGNPKTVPAGVYAQEMLQTLGLWEKLQPKLVLADHVRQVLDYASRGEVDAALVYRTDVELMPDSVTVVAEAPQGTHRPIEYGIAIIRTSRNPTAARSFLDLATNSEGVELLTSHGFSRPRT